MFFTEEFRGPRASRRRRSLVSILPAAAALTLFVPFAAAAAPGSASFIASTLAVDENVVAATIQVRRTGGTDGEVSVRVQTSNGSAVSGADYEELSEVLTWANGDATNKTVLVPIIGDSAPEPIETFTVTLSEPLGGLTLTSPSTARVAIDDDDEPTGPCEADESTLCLGQADRFRVRATFEAPDGAAGAARTFTIAQLDSGIFYFFNLDNPELLVKVLNGCGINSRYWVLYAATTDVRFTLSVTDTERGTTRTYRNPQGQLADAVIDTGAFATCPDSPPDTTVLHPAASPEAAVANPEKLSALAPAPAPKAWRDEGALGTCVDDPTTLCLNVDGRFQVRATYSAFSGAAGDAKAIHLALRDGGIFYFFDQNNAEMLVKVLDGCNINDRFWVLFAGATDVHFTLTVIDTTTGETREYENPQGHLADAVIDIGAFDTCLTSD
jgi:hypothetical protein